LDEDICWFGSRKWFFPLKFAQFPKAGEKRSKAVNEPDREECNKYDLTGAPCF